MVKAVMAMAAAVANANTASSERDLRSVWLRPAADWIKLAENAAQRRAPGWLRE
jgi:hypothetical protein